MMELLEIVKSVADLGFIVVAAGFVLWQVFRSFTQDKKRENEDHDLKNNRYEILLDDLQKKQDILYGLLIDSNKNTEARCEKMIEKLIAIINKPHVLSQEENDRMTKIDIEIDSYLERILNVCNATRVHLIKYHNGGNDMLGNSILKMSMSNEKCAVGVTHIQRTCQNQLRNYSPVLTKGLNENGICFIEDRENFKDIDNSLYQFMVQAGIVAKYAIAITNTKNNSVIGYLSIDFADNKHIDLEQVKHCLNDKKVKIETLLNLNND